MKKFETPEIEVVNFAVEDIITASDGTTQCGNETDGF